MNQIKLNQLNQIVQVDWIQLFKSCKLYKSCNDIITLLSTIGLINEIILSIVGMIYPLVIGHGHLISINQTQSNKLTIATYLNDTL